jgi:excisionase family DNA binding protein
MDATQREITLDDLDLELLTAPEAAKLLKVDASTVYRLMMMGELRSVRWGRCVRIRKPDLQEFITLHLGGG